MSETPASQNLQVTNPFQAASEIFYKPTAVFDALNVRDNWSWIPFLLLMVILFIPSYLYFGIVDFDWWLDVALMPQFGDLAPAQQEMMLQQYSPAQMQLTTGIIVGVFMIIQFAVFAFYFSMMTRNDEKSMHGFTDWYGAMWWTTMPALLNALISLVLLTFQDSGAQIDSSILAPMSVAFLIGAEMDSESYNLLLGLRFDIIWTIALTAICIKSWTNFSQGKSIAVAAIPYLAITVFGLAFA